MSYKTKIEERVQEILEAKGRKVLEEAKKVMHKDIKSKDLQAPLQYLAEHWNDTLRPALFALSCEAVGGKPETTTSSAIAMTLTCSWMNIYDHIMDRTPSKLFRPTLPGKFGNGLALITGGVVAAKAYSALYELAEKEIPPEKRAKVNKIFHEFILKMAEAEAMNLRLRRRGNISIAEKYQVLQMQAADIEACVKIGATIGCGSNLEIKQLGKYGLLLGTLIELREDLWEALNYTLELADKIKNGALPYVLIWAINHSARAQNLLLTLTKKEKIKPTDIKKVVEVMFETGAVNHVKKLSKKLINRATHTLVGIRECEAKESFRLLARGQRSLLFAGLFAS